MRTLEYVNAATAQTWNYMHINEISLDVPEPAEVAQAIAGAGAVECPAQTELRCVESVDERFAAIETGIGEEAVAWVEAAAPAVEVAVPAGVELDAPITVDLAKARAANVMVSLGENARAHIVVIADDVPGAAGFSASLVRLDLAADAHADIFEIVALPEDRAHLEGFGIECAERASVNVRQYSLSGGTSVIGLAANMAGAESAIDVQLHYLGRGSQTIDVNHLVRMRGRDTRARIDESGVLADESHKTLRATIDLVKGGKGAKGREQETVVVTGDGVVNKTLPVILCNEEDVQGDHGATIGSMSADQLEYMRNRGLSTKQAEELFERAMVDEAVIHAPSKRAHEVALEAATALFGQDAAGEIAGAMNRSWGE